MVPQIEGNMPHSRRYSRMSLAESHATLPSKLSLRTAGYYGTYIAARKRQSIRQLNNNNNNNARVSDRRQPMSSNNHDDNRGPVVDAARSREDHGMERHHHGVRRYPPSDCHSLVSDSLSNRRTLLPKPRVQERKRIFEDDSIDPSMDNDQCYNLRSLQPKRRMHEVDGIVGELRRPPKPFSSSSPLLRQHRRTDFKAEKFNLPSLRPIRVGAPRLVSAQHRTPNNRSLLPPSDEGRLSFRSKLIPRDRAPPSSRIVPQSSRIVPQSSRIVPQSSRIVPQLSRVVPQSSRILPQSSRVVPQSSRVVPQSPRIVPQSSRIVPQSSRVVPSRLSTYENTSFIGGRYKSSDTGKKQILDNVRNPIDTQDTFQSRDRTRPTVIYQKRPRYEYNAGLPSKPRISLPSRGRIDQRPRHSTQYAVRYSRNRPHDLVEDRSRPSALRPKGNEGPSFSGAAAHRRLLGNNGSDGGKPDRQGDDTHDECPSAEKETTDPITSDSRQSTRLKPEEDDCRRRESNKASIVTPTADSRKMSDKDQSVMQPTASESKQMVVKKPSNRASLVACKQDISPRKPDGGRIRRVEDTSDDRSHRVTRGANRAPSPRVHNSTRSRGRGRGFPTSGYFSVSDRANFQTVHSSTRRNHVMFRGLGRGFRRPMMNHAKHLSHLRSGSADGANAYQAGTTDRGRQVHASFVRHRTRVYDADGADHNDQGIERSSDAEYSPRVRVNSDYRTLTRGGGPGRYSGNNGGRGRGFPRRSFHGGRQNTYQAVHQRTYDHHHQHPKADRSGNMKQNFR